MTEIGQGDRVRFVPKNSKRWDEFEGLVIDEVNGGDGYNLLCPLPGDPGRIVRLWRRDGDFVVLEKHVPEPPKAAPASNRFDERKPEVLTNLFLEMSAEDAARRYRGQGLSVHGAWNQYVIDCGLCPQFDFKVLIKAWR